MGQNDYFWAVLGFILIFAPFILFTAFNPGLPTGYFSVNANGPNISVEVSVGSNSANISWQTDVLANATLNVSGQVETISYSTNFIVAVEDLSPNTTYYFDIFACNNDSDCTLYESSFTTNASVEDITAPMIDIDVSVGEYSVNISWTADEEANATLSFNGGLTNFGFNTSFLHTLTSLEPDTEYDYSITSCDLAGNCAETTGQFITNIDEEKLRITDVNISTTDTTAKLKWRLNKNVTAKLHYANVLIIYPLATEFTANLHHLQSNTIYIYNFSACTPENECVFMLSNFTTQLPSDIYEPELVYNISTTNNSATLTWSTNEEATSIVTFQGSTHITDYDTSFSYMFNGLEPGTTYSGTITVCDRANNCNVQAFSFTTREDLEVVGPEITFTVYPGDTYATIMWTSSEIVTSIFSMGGGGTSYGPETQFEKMLTELTPSTTYHFTITVCDLEINCNSQQGSFTTLEAPPEIPEEPQVIAIAAQQPEPEEPDRKPAVLGQPISEQPTEIELFGQVHQRVIEDQPTLEQTSGFVLLIVNLIRNRLLVSLILAFLVSIIIVNVTSLLVNREVPICNSSKHTNYLINRVNTMIQDKKLHEAYELYPSIVKHYNKIKNEKNKERFRERIRLLYRQLSLFLAMQRVQYTLNHYSKVSEDKLKKLYTYLDFVIQETKRLKKEIPYKQYKALREHVAQEHGKCLEHLYEVRKKSITRTK